MGGGTVFVIAGGALRDPAFLRAQLETFAPAEIVCADGGTRHLVALGMTPQVIVGDLDSLDPVLLKHCEEKGSRIVRYPAHKDRTDTWLALEYALERNPAQVLIFGALGGRIDHTLGNISLLALAAERGVATRLIDEWSEVFVVTAGGTSVLAGEKGQTVSLLPLTAEVAGIRLTGFEYPLDGGCMEIGRPYGVSNRLLAAKGTVAVAAGMLLVVRYFRPGFFPEGV